MGGQDINKGLQIQKLYHKLMDESKGSTEKEKAAEAVATLDRDLGEGWRELFSPDGLDLGEIVEGGSPASVPASSLHDKVRGMLHKKGFDSAGYNNNCMEDEEVEEEPKSLKQRVKIAVEVSGG